MLPSRRGFIFTLNIVPAGKRGRGNALLRHGRGARHLHAPIDVLPVLIFGEFAVRPDQIEMDFGMVGLSDELVGHAG